MGWGVLLTLAVLGANWHAPDEHVRRYALLVAANHGAVDEPTLRFAQSDLDRIAKTLSDVAGVPADNIYTLRDPSNEDVRSQFRSLRKRAANDSRTGGESMLFVYYSGHADAIALHLGSTSLPWAELLRLTREVDVTARVVLADACRSGALTELKGLMRDQPIALPNHEELPKGLAIMTSASAGEAAQESRDLEGSFFTHHFIAAMRGAADNNHDGRVTLNEAFAYASAQTSQSTASTMVGVQHATYRFSLQGRHELVLTADRDHQEGAPVRLTQPGTYVFRNDGADGPLALEATVGSSERSVLLPYGHYDVRRRTSAHLYHGEISVDRDKPQGVYAIAMNLDDHYDPVLTKGVAEPDPALLASEIEPEPSAPAIWSMEAFAGTAGSLVPHFRTPGEFGVLIARRQDNLVVDLQLIYGRDSAQSSTLSTTQNEVGGAIGVRGVVAEGDVFDLSTGGRLGGLWVQQQFDAASGYPTASQFVPTAQFVLRGEAHLPYGFFFSCEGSARGAVYSVLNNNGSTSSMHFSVAPMVVLGFGGSW